MRKALVVLLGVCLLALFVGSVSARDIDRSGKRFVRNLSDEVDPALIDQGARSLMTSAAVDTYCIIWFDFEPMSWQGWTREDNTAQLQVWWHVDDFAGLGGGDYGALVPVEGLKSMWCGTRPGTSTYMCSWVYAPGYGNGWNQILVTDPFMFYQAIEFTYKMSWDSEPGYDFTFVEYDAGGGNWTELAVYDNWGAGTVTHVLQLAQLATKLRFNFTSDSAWSDQDGLWNTDGAVIVDSLVIVDGNGVINEEDFEDATLNATEWGIWNGEMADAYGIYGGMNSGLIDKEPCADNFSAQLTFWGANDGVANPPEYPSADYPGLYETPFCRGPGGIEAPCQDESVVSPIINMLNYSTSCDENQNAAIPAEDLNALRGAILRFTTYRDLPDDNLVYYTWSVREIVDGCPMNWRDRNYVYYGPDRDYIQNFQDISDFVGANPIQVRVGCIDMCQYWYEEPGQCAEHTPSPWLDNVRVHRYKTLGPSWSYRDIDIFNDQFPTVEWVGATSELEWYCRADIANDTAPNDELDRITPGDSSVVTVSAPMAGGLDTLVTGEARVYMHVDAVWMGPAPAPTDLTGAQMEGDWGTYLYDEGSWSVFLCDSAKTGGGAVSPDKYSCDLNDALFTRGWMIEYYFKAYDAEGYSSTLPGTAEEADGNVFEFTCLPLMKVVPTALYCDDFEHRGTFDGQVQQYWDPAFQAVCATDDDLPDRYDTNAPTSGVSNGVGAYVNAEGGSKFFNQAYEKIIWDSGDLDAYTISDGTGYSDKSNDAKLLNDWLNYVSGTCGLLVMGDNILTDLAGSSAASATTLMANCGIQLVETSYYELTGGDAGGVISPLVSGVAGTFMDGLSYYIFGGCPIINQFDVIEASGLGAYLLEYPEYPAGTKRYAGISTEDQVANKKYHRTVWVGHSFMYIRNAENTTLARNEFLKRVYDFFENDTAVNYTDDKTPKVYGLSQNFPNPFNPTTTIKFALPSKGHVSLKVYNVAGQLVKTLSDEVWEAGSHELTWDGTNNLGASVASGVYFYKLDADGKYENMKKMVLLR